MKILNFLNKQPTTCELVTFESNNYNMEYRKIFDGFSIIIDFNNSIIISNDKWSKINFKQHYEEKKFNNFMLLCEKINKYYNVIFSIFPDTLKKDDYYLSTLTMFTDRKHPIDFFHFKANQPKFPFTTNLDMLDSNLYHFEQFKLRLKYILRYMDIKNFINLVKLRATRNYDFLIILESTYSNLGGNIGQIIDLFCTEGPDYREQICRHLIPLLEQGLDKIDFLPKEYIKIY
jgi:hypothetical protein